LITHQDGGNGFAVVFYFNDKKEYTYIQLACNVHGLTLESGIFSDIDYLVDDLAPGVPDATAEIFFCGY
jgi:hypothetical protein